MSQAIEHLIFVLHNYYFVLKEQRKSHSILNLLFNEYNIYISEEFTTQMIHLMKIYNHIACNTVMTEFIMSIKIALISNIQADIVYRDNPSSREFYTLFRSLIHQLLQKNIPPPTRDSILQSHFDKDLSTIIRKYDYFFEGILDLQFDDTFTADKYFELTDTDIIPKTRSDIFKLLQTTNTGKDTHYSGKEGISDVLPGGYISTKQFEYETYIVRFWKNNRCECILLIKTFDIKYIHTVNVGEIIFKLTDDQRGTLMVWNFISGHCRLILKDHTCYISDFATFNNKIISVSSDNTLRIWSLKTGDCESILPHQHHDYVDMHISSSQNEIRVSTSTDESSCISTWNLETKEHTVQIEAEDDDEEDKDYDATSYRTDLLDSRSIIISKTGLKIWNPHTKINELIIEDYTYLDNYTDIFINGLIIGVCKDKRFLILYNSITGEKEFMMGQHTSNIKMCKSIGTTKIITLCEDNILRLWDICTKQCESRSDVIDHICNYHILECEKIMVISRKPSHHSLLFNNIYYRLYDFSEGNWKLILGGPDTEFSEYIILPDKTLMVKCTDNIFKQWNMETNKYQLTMKDKDIISLHVQPDKRIFTKHTSGTKKIWR